jgi:peptidoglycan/xylan/chitin deacetylase (PgdA/CDA1 family)
MVPILLYHEISAPPDTTFSRLAVTPQVFETQLEYLVTHGFTTFTASAIAAALATGAPLPERAVVLTFDDGFADFHERVLPLLRKYGCTATLFVTTGWIADAGRRAAGPKPERMLTWRQIVEAAADGIEIGAHSHTHPQLDQLGREKLRTELTVSKKLLEDALGTSVIGLAYPFGYSNVAVRRAALEGDYAYACAVANAMASPQGDPFALPRLTIKASTGEGTFGHAVYGQNLSELYRTEWMLTRGWAVVRRTRAIVTGVPVRA